MVSSLIPRTEPAAEDGKASRYQQNTLEQNEVLSPHRHTEREGAPLQSEGQHGVVVNWGFPAQRPDEARCWELEGAACGMGKSLTLLDDLLGLLPDSGITQEPPLSLLADLALQVVLFWDLSVYEHIHNTKQQ